MRFYTEQSAALFKVRQAMEKKPRIPAGVDENGQLIAHVSSPGTKLRGFKKVVDIMMRDALMSWTEIWEEFQDTVVTRSGFVLPEAAKSFKPKCGWPEFMEKLWLLKHQLDFTKRLCENQQ